VTRPSRRATLTGFAFLFSLAVSSAAQPPPDRLKLAEDLARAHSVLPQGREWLNRHRTTAGKLMIPILQRCVEEPGEPELMAFSLFVRLSQKGKVLEVVTDLDAALGRCMTREAKDVKLPDTPREGFWIQLNLAAPL
jgi:hypothetical protein